MTEMIHGLVSGLIWAAVLGSFLLSIAAVITAIAPSGERMRDMAAGTTRALELSSIRVTERRTRSSTARPRGSPVAR